MTVPFHILKRLLLAEGVHNWVDFSSSLDGTQAQEPHPLTKEWSKRINNKSVRAEFMKESIDSYTAAHKLKVWTGTWNTNGKPPPVDLDISSWLDVMQRPDLVVMGFQEIVPLTPGKVLAVEDSAATGEWEAIIDRTLNGVAAAGGTVFRARSHRWP